MSVTVVSICGRAEKGISRPFFCEASDGHYYFLKRNNVSPDQLLVEYVIGRLAEECGLPVAPIEILEVPADLARYSLVDGKEDFRPGPAFGSRRIPFADEVRTSHLRQIDEETKMRCLCFDWWVQNPDRRLDLLGGDSNLLWDPVLQSVFLIDHDLCLDSEFDEMEFKREHAFRDVRPFLEREFYEKWRTKFESTIYNLGKIWEEIPQEWFVDDSGVDLVSLSRQEIESRLIKPANAAEEILPA